MRGYDPTQWRMTEAQFRGYWYWWNRACKAQGWHKLSSTQREDLRRRVHAEVFGSPVSAKEIDSTSGYGRIKARFQALADIVRGAVESDRPQDDEQRRQLWVIRERILPCLALYVEDAAAYVREILRWRFKLTAGINTIEDLSAVSAPRMVNGRPVNQSEIEMLRDTLNGRLHAFRRKAKHTLHDMCLAAGIECNCAPCKLLRARQIKLRSTPAPAPVQELVTEPEPELVDQPF